MLPGISGTIQDEAKEQSGGFLSMLLGILEAILSGNILTGKGALAKRQSQREKVEGKKELVMDLILNQKKINFLFLVHPLRNIEIKRYYQNEPTFINLHSLT